MTTFANTTAPTPFGFYDADTGFQTEADNIITFIKRKLGDDILSVELTKKQIWACFEEATLEYSSIINMHEAESSLLNMLGFATGSETSGSFNVGPHGKESMLQRFNHSFVNRMAAAYSTEANTGGDYNQVSGSIELVKGVQDYNIYTDLKNSAGDILFDTQDVGSKTKMKITEVFHFNPQDAYRFFSTTSATNYMANEFPFESYTPETVFYVLPVFEDVLRAGMMNMSNRVRRSNFSYKIIGTNIRIYPKPTSNEPKRLWMRVLLGTDPFKPGYTDDSLYGVSNTSNVPFGHLTYKYINSMGRQWIRQYAIALSKELLGYVRSKFGSVPIPGGEVNLNGTELVAQGQGEKETLKTQLREQLGKLTYNALIASAADEAEALNRLLKLIPMPNGLTIFTG